MRQRSATTKADDRHDYVKLALPMKLGEYRVKLPWYPWLDRITPFENWLPVLKGSKQKQYLPWYDAYNAVKHDRENDFSQAKLVHAFQALAGCFVMLCAQYGWNFARREDAAADMFSQLVDAPKWEPSELTCRRWARRIRQHHIPSELSGPAQPPASPPATLAATDEQWDGLLRRVQAVP
jgi:hypothetical protein